MQSDEKRDRAKRKESKRWRRSEGNDRESHKERVKGRGVKSI